MTLSWIVSDVFRFAVSFISGCLSLWKETTSYRDQITEIADCPHIRLYLLFAIPLHFFVASKIFCKAIKQCVKHMCCTPDTDVYNSCGPIRTIVCVFDLIGTATGIWIYFFMRECENDLSNSGNSRITILFVWLGFLFNGFNLLVVVPISFKGAKSPVVLMITPETGNPKGDI